MKQEAKDKLAAYWDHHPAAYIAMREEQMERCKFKNGKIKKMFQDAYNYYELELILFETRHMFDDVLEPK